MMEAYAGSATSHRQFEATIRENAYQTEWRMRDT